MVMIRALPLFTFFSAVIKLSYAYYNVTKDLSLFDNEWKSAMYSIVSVIKNMQMGTDEGPQPYFFQRQASNPTDTLLWGIGGPAKR